MKKVSPAAFAPFTAVSRTMTLDDFRARYAYVKILHQTRNSTIRLAVHVSTGQNVIVKAILKSNLNSERKITALFREIQTLLLLKDSKHVIKLYDVADVGDSFYLVMEFADNGDLCNYLQSNINISEGQIKYFFRSILKTVAALHSKNLVHRDLKLENIMLDTNLRVLLGDFGFAKMYKNTDDLCTSICGTAHYEPPEIIKGDAYDPVLADSWSLGVIFYIMLFKEFPFSCPSITETLQLILCKDIKYPDNDYSEETIDLLNSLLCKDVCRRITPNEAMNHPFIKRKKKKYSNIRSKKEMLHEQALSTILCPKDEFGKLSADELVSYEIVKRRYQLLPKKAQQQLQHGSIIRKGSWETRTSTSDISPILLGGEQTKSINKRDKLTRVQSELSPRKCHSKPTFYEDDPSPISIPQKQETISLTPLPQYDPKIFINKPLPYQQQQKQQLQFQQQQQLQQLQQNQQQLQQNLQKQQQPPAFLRNETYPMNPLQNLLNNQNKIDHTTQPRVLRNPVYLLRSTPNSAPERKYDLKHTPLNRPLSPIAEQQTKFSNCSHSTKEEPIQIMQSIIGIVQKDLSISLISREELSAYIKFKDLYACVSCGQVSDELNGYMVDKIRGEDATLKSFEEILSNRLGY